ncbi:MAG TPA: T9SS type A sorting domain-containing protein [Chitinophagaceae bacterium]|nr:T9SS type A sorting domain-containing protein [Chitinophagaceae bacterium]
MDLDKALIVQTGPNGEVYVCWADYTNNTFPAQGIGFVKSTNGGVSFTSPTVPVHYVGIRTFGGGDPAFNYTGVNDFPSMAVDKSNVHKGRIYIVFAAKENGNGKAVVQITWSDNGGTIWTTPKTISITNGRQNWFPWIAVDDANGKVYVDYYSLDQATGFSTNTYVAYSYDGGATFQNQIVSDVPHTTQAINNTIFGYGYAGDYIGMTAYNDKVYAAWMDNRSGTWQIYVSKISDVSISGNDFFCSSSIYSILNLPSGATVNWSTSPTGIGNLSCTTCPSTTLSKSTVGAVTLTATINPGCGLPTTISKIVDVGFAPVKDSSVQTSSCSGTYQTWAEYAVPVANATQWLWTKGYVPPGSDIYIDNPNSSNTFVDVSGGGTIKLTYTDVCGNVMTDGATIYSNCHSPNIASFDIIPNPAVNNVSIKSNTQTLSKGNNKNSIYAIKILDGFGNQRKLFQYKSGITLTTIPISDLKSGIYLISVFDGNRWISKSLIIQK